MTVPLGHNLPSPQDTPRDHHGAGSPESHEPCRWSLLPGLTGEGVPLSGHSLWRQKQEGDRVLVGRHGRKGG